MRISDWSSDVCSSDLAGLLQLADLLDQRRRREHHAVADQAQRVVAQDARGDQVQHGLLAADHQRVAGVVAALEAHHRADRSEEHTSELQSLMRISYAVFCLKKKKHHIHKTKNKYQLNS